GGEDGPDVAAGAGLAGDEIPMGKRGNGGEGGGDEEGGEFGGAAADAFVGEQQLPARIVEGDGLHGVAAGAEGVEPEADGDGGEHGQGDGPEIRGEGILTDEDGFVGIFGIDVGGDVAMVEGTDDAVGPTGVAGF